MRVKLLGTIGPSLLAFDKEVVLSGPIHGTFWHATTTPPVYIIKADVTPVSAAAPAPDSAPAADPYAGLAPMTTNAEIVAFEAQPGIAALEAAAFARFNTALAAYQAARGHKPDSAEPQAVMFQIAASVNASILIYAGKFGPTDNTYSR